MGVDGQVALITGATAGIGRQAALELARRGVSVIIVGRDLDRGTAAATAIAQESGNGLVMFEQADAASQQSLRDRHRARRRAVPAPGYPGQQRGWAVRRAGADG